MNPQPLDFGQCLRGRVCFVGVGSLDHGDDSAGLRLAESLAAAFARHPGSDGPESRSAPRVLLAHRSPERYLGEIAQGRPDNVIFLDAVRFGAAPGSVILLPTAEVRSAYPQVSTHRISLGLLGVLLEEGSSRQAWVLGIEPDSLQDPAELSPAVADSIRLLTRILVDLHQRGPIADDPIGESLDPHSVPFRHSIVPVGELRRTLWPPDLPTPAT